MKRFFGFWRRERETLNCRAEICFLADDTVVPQVAWQIAQPGPDDWLRLVLFYYARILFELAELNETRVARELMAFVARVGKRLAAPSGEAGKITIPLGKLRLGGEIKEPSQRTYRAALYANRQGGYRLEFNGALGKERFYLPASLLALLQHIISLLAPEHLERLTRGLDRLHLYYRYKRDFWDSAALAEGPRLAMGNETISEPDPDFEAP